ncbi:hypothetical protein LINPERHAP2_LOCUS13818 [Linum perenne]
MLGINVLAACNLDSEFIYYQSGWEGSAHDDQVLQDAIARPNGSHIPKGAAPHLTCNGHTTRLHLNTMSMVMSSLLECSVGQFRERPSKACSDGETSGETGDPGGG